MPSPHLPSFALLCTCLLIWLGINPAKGFDEFKPTPSLNAETSYTGAGAYGDDWIAYQAGSDKIEIANRSTGQVVRSIQKPASSPTRTINGIGSAIAADGKYFAAVCGATFPKPNGLSGQGWSIFVWDVTTGVELGSSDVPFSWQGFTPFLGIGNGRVALTDPSQRFIRVWDLATMTPQASVVIPDTLPIPAYDTWSGNTVVMGGDHLVYYHNGQGQSQLQGPFLVDVNLATGVVKGLSRAGNQHYMQSVPLATNGKHLLAAYSAASSLELIHYDLDTSQMVRLTSLAQAPFPALMRPVISASGNWHLLVTEGVRTLRMTSGLNGYGPAESTITFDTPGEQLGAAQFVDDTGLWFRTGANAPPGVLAYRQPLNGFPRSLVAVRCAPSFEADGAMQLSVTANPAPATPLTLHLKTADGSAKANQDYTALDTDVLIPAGETEVTVALSLLQDMVLEKNESLFVDITAADPGAMIVKSRASGVIGGSSFNSLPPVAPWPGDGEHQPSSLTMAGGYLVQSNRTVSWMPVDGKPALVRRPFDSGDWTTSTGWGRALVPAGSVQFGESRGRLALAREYSAISVYDPAEDRVVYRITDNNGLSNVPASLGDTHLLTADDHSSMVEYSLDPPHAPRSISIDFVRRGDNLHYLKDYIVSGSSNPLHLTSRADGSYVGSFPGRPGWHQPSMSSDGNLLAVENSTGAWVCDFDKGRDFVELIPADGPFTAISAILVRNGRVFITEKKHQTTPVVKVFESDTGVQIDTLMEDVEALRLPGAPVFNPGYDRSSAQVSNLAIEGNRGALLYWTGTSGGYQDYHVARFEESDKLPSLVPPAPTVEGAGAIDFKLGEAVPWPLTVTTRAIAAGYNEDADWTNSGVTVVVPAGATSFSSGIVTADDSIPEDLHRVALEVTVSGNGSTETRRVEIELTDNDLLEMESVSPVQTPNWSVVAPVGEGWAYRTIVGQLGQGISWTEDPGFTQISPAGDPARYAFANAMAGSEGWLAVAQRHYGPRMGTEFPSRIYIYRPGDSKTPVRVIKGQKHTARFGQALFARGTSFWVGAPGLEGLVPRAKSPGKAYEYDFRTGKVLRTYKAQKGYAESFGSAFAANDGNTWVGSPYVSGSGAISQYSRTGKGRFLAILKSPLAGAGRVFGTKMVASADTLIASTVHDGLAQEIYPGAVHGFSAASGGLLWTLQAPPASQTFGSSLALLPGNILAVGGRSIFFYLLQPGAPPRLLLELRPSYPFSNAITRMEVNGFFLATQEDDWAGSNPGRLFDIRNIPPLVPYLPGPPVASLLSTANPRPAVPELSLAAAENGWQLMVGPIPEAWATPDIVTILESSEDLAKWTRVAQYAGGDSWQLYDEAGAAVLAVQQGGTFHFPKGPEKRYFRLTPGPALP